MLYRTTLVMTFDCILEKIDHVCHNGTTMDSVSMEVCFPGCVCNTNLMQNSIAVTLMENSIAEIQVHQIDAKVCTCHDSTDVQHFVVIAVTEFGKKQNKTSIKLTMKGASWPSPGSNFTRSAHEFNLLKEYDFKITTTCPRGQWECSWEWMG